MPLSRRVAKLLALLSIPCAAGLVFAQPALAVWPGENGKIVFWKADFTALTAQIYSMNSNGTDQVNLSVAGGGANQIDIQPSVSPNGKKIAFSRVFDLSTLTTHIWTMDLNGSNQTDITGAATASESNPSWSEDGSRILFVRTSANMTSADIWIRKANGRGTAQQLTSGSFDANPVMSPDGDLIAFSRLTAAGPHIFVMKADGSEPPVDLGQGAKPDWSPDSTRLVYGQGGSGPIMVIKVSDPTDKHVLAPMGNEAPVWSPDGTQIVFLHCVAHQVCDIALMTASGGNRHTITNDVANGASDLKPDWQRAHGEGGENSA